MAQFDEILEVAQFPRGRRGDQAVVRVIEMSEGPVVDVRRFYETDDGELKPTQKGHYLTASEFVEILGAKEAILTSLGLTPAQVAAAVA